MSTTLVPCAACARHVKQGECACPFCGAKVACTKPSARAPGGRMSRAALFSAGAVGVVLGTSDCAVVPHYGGLMPIDASEADDGSVPPPDGSVALDAASEGPAVVQPEDGAVPAPDAGLEIDSGEAADATAGPDTADASDEADARPRAMPLYGGFMPPDAARGSNDSGGG